MKSICFHCHFVGVGLNDARCPECAHPLIVNMSSAVLATQELQTVFARARAKTNPLPLPGVSVEKRQAQLLMERRKQKQEERQLQKRAESEQAWRQSRRRYFTRLFAATAAVVLVMFVTLNLTGAL
jgi:hypothetical protein